MEHAHMMADQLLQTISQAGGRVTVDGGNLVLKAPRPLPDDLLAEVKRHKADLLAALAYNVDTEAEDLHEHFEERAGILEYDAELPRAEAELEAAKITSTYARNCCYQWASLRAALSAYPELLASLPDKAGPVNSLPLGVSKLAVLTGRRVLRQGVFTSEHLIKSGS